MSNCITKPKYKAKLEKKSPIPIQFRLCHKLLTFTQHKTINYMNNFYDNNQLPT